MITKDQKLLTEAYQTIREIQSLKESDSLNSIVNIGLANYYKKYLVEYTIGNKPPTGMTNVNISGSDATNVYEPANIQTGTTTSGDEIQIHGSEREMAIEKAAIETTRALLIFLTHARIDPIIRMWLNVFRLKDRSLKLTPDEQVQLDGIERGIQRVTNLHKLTKEEGINWYFSELGVHSNAARKRYIELLRKKDDPANFEYIASEKDRVTAQEKILKRLKRLTDDSKLQDELEDIVDFMVAFLGNNPDAIEMLDLPKYKEGEEPSPETTVNGHDHDGPGGIGGESLPALPGIAELAIHILGIGGATALGAGAVLGNIVVKKSKGLINALKGAPKKILALMQGHIRPALQDKPSKDENKPGGWEIEVSNGKWEPVVA
jgi:hypothetical protein